MAIDLALDADLGVPVSYQPDRSKTGRAPELMWAERSGGERSTHQRSCARFRDTAIAARECPRR
jgi:hypothetical protein